MQVHLLCIIKSGLLALCFTVLNILVFHCFFSNYNNAYQRLSRLTVSHSICKYDAVWWPGDIVVFGTCWKLFISCFIFPKNFRLFSRHFVNLVFVVKKCINEALLRRAERAQAQAALNEGCDATPRIEACALLSGPNRMQVLMKAERPLRAMRRSPCWAGPSACRSYWRQRGHSEHCNVVFLSVLYRLCLASLRISGRGAVRSYWALQLRRG